MSSAPTIVEFVKDPQLLGLELSDAQECLLRAIYGLPLSTDQLALWAACTGREAYSGEPYAEVTVVAGARAGKDSGIDFTWGVGVGINLGKWITIRGEWESFEVKDTDGVTLVSAGVQINF